MSSLLPIRSALISVYYKDGLDVLVHTLHTFGVSIHSTGGTLKFIETLGVPVIPVENTTMFPEILDGRVKTLHPKIFGGILYRRDNEHDQQTVNDHQIPPFDLVVVDLYPFEETVNSTEIEAEIIEKIDIGGVSLLRAAAKNYAYVAVLSERSQYPSFIELLNTHQGATTKEERKNWAAKAFSKTQQYDAEIARYFHDNNANKKTLRYGENPHQSAYFEGNLGEIFDQINGKELSYNNLLDIDAAFRLMSDFSDNQPAFAILKHNNACGAAISDSLENAYKLALESDPLSAFGGVLIANQAVGLGCARLMHTLFFEILIAPSFEPEALALLREKPNRIILQSKSFAWSTKSERSLLNGRVVQDNDLSLCQPDQWAIRTQKGVHDAMVEDLKLANILVKHTKSNAIAIVKNNRLIACGTGQTSRVDALKQAIEKAQYFGLPLEGAVMASDAFFPFPDCVEIAIQVGIVAIIQPGGSVKDHLSIEACDRAGIAMVFTGMRHFKH